MQSDSHIKDKIEEDALDAADAKSVNVKVGEVAHELAQPGWNLIEWRTALAELG